MAAPTLKPGTGKELRRLFALLMASLGDTVGSLVNKHVVVRPDEPEVRDPASWLADLPRPGVLARGAMEKAFTGRSLFTLFETPDAIAMAALLTMTPDDVIAVRRTKGVLEREDAEAFGEVGNVLYAGLGNVLRDQLGNIDVRFQDRGLVKPGVDESGLLGRDTLLVYGFRMKVGEYPESTGALAIDRLTAEAWNKGPLELGTAAAPVSPVAKDTGAATNANDEGFEYIPAAPIRGTLAAFVLRADALRTLRHGCRRIGLDVRRHGRGEIPNPAAHRNEIVVIDVPPGEERRFGWCRRLKEMAGATKVVVLIHQPSRQRVTQAFLSRADVILGFPCAEQELAQKLESLMPAATRPPAAP